MLIPGHVYLQSHYTTNLLASVELRRDVSAGTLRKGATVKETITLQPSRMLDVTKVLNVDRETALRIIKISPDLVRWKQHFEVIDADNRPKEFAPAGPNIGPPEPVAPPTIEAPKAARPAIMRAEAIAAQQALHGADSDDPSITWKREKLEQHALTIGIKVLATMNKATILRKIREASK